MKWTVKAHVSVSAAVAFFAAMPLVAQAPASAAPTSVSRPAGPNNQANEPFDFNNNEGFTSLFDGKSLAGWDGDPNLWSINDGAIYIHPTCEKPTGTVYTVWQGGEPADFILKYELKGNGRVNGGMQFRSYHSAAPTGTVFPPRPPRPPMPPGAQRPNRVTCDNPGTPPSKASQAKWDLLGPQADFDAGDNYPGMFYEQGGRGIVSTPGHVILSENDKPISVVATLADKPTLEFWFHKDDWNQFVIICKGHSTSIFMNGHLITQFIDNNSRYFRPSGKIGIEVESTGEYWIRNVQLKNL